VSNLPSGSYVATDHNSLSGRSNANTHPASAITNTPAGTVAATDVQAAIDELDTEKEAVANKSTDGTLAANSTTLYPSQSAVKTYADTKVAKVGDTVTGTLQMNDANKVAFFSSDYFIRASTGLEIQTADTIRFLGASATEFARFDSTGKLGIGVAPSYALDVQGPPNDDILNLRATGAGTLGIRMAPSGASSNSAKIIATLNGTDTDLALRTGGVNNLVVSSTGLLTAPGVYANTDASAANVYVDSSGNLKRSTASGGGSGTVNSGLTGDIAYYAANSTAVSPHPKLNVNSAGGFVLNPTNGASSIPCMVINNHQTGVKSGFLSLYANNGGTAGKFNVGINGHTDGSTIIDVLNGSNTPVPLNINASSLVIPAGSASVPGLIHAGDTNTGIYAPAADEWAVSTGGTLNLHAKLTSGAPRLGVGVAPSYSLDIKQSLSGNDVDFNLENTNASANGVYMAMASAAGYCKKQMKTLGTGDVHINFVSGNSSTKQFTMGMDYSDTKAFVISRSGTLGTTNVLKFVESNGYVAMQGVYDQTTASAANVYVDSSGNLMRSTSSLRYKTAIQEVPQVEAAKLLDLTPVTYASLCESDNKEERHYGFIAEELDLLDPTLVNYKTLEDGTKVPDGVQYERVVVGLLKLVQDLTTRVKALEEKNVPPVVEETPEAPQE
jgi:hypothetical protein